MDRDTRAFLLSVATLAGISLWLGWTPGKAVGLRDRTTRLSQLARLPVYFIANQGQAGSGVAYYVQGRSTQALFTPAAVVYTLRNPRLFQSAAVTPASVATVRQEFLGANAQPEIVGLDETPAKVNYFVGPAERWVTNVPTYSTIVYRDLWPDIDLVFSGPEGNLKYTFHVRPGADPRQIRFAYRGAASVSLTAKGSLHVDTPAGGFADDAPVAWQESGARRDVVQAAFRLAGEQVEFELGRYDRTRELIVDPVVLLYSGYVGGGSEDKGRAIAVDSIGASYITGYTVSSTGFPTTAGMDTTYNDGGDAFVTKVNPAGTGLVYSTYLGGSGSDYGEGIAVDGSGNAHVTGYTYSAAFPTTVGAYDTSFNGFADVYVTKLNAAGNALIYSTYIGGAVEDRAWGIALDSAGNAHIAGDTDSPNFPNTGSIALGGKETFGVKINSTGSAIAYAVRIGGSGEDQARGIAVDAAGNAYITGFTTSPNFPTTVGPSVFFGGGTDAFVYKLNALGTILTYSGYIGGTGLDVGTEIDVDPSGSAYVTGHTSSGNFPTTAGAFDTTHNGMYDAFVSKVSANGTGLAYSTFLGGTSNDYGRDIAADAVGNAYVLGNTESGDFPVNSEGPDTTANGQSDVFVAKLNAAGAGLSYSGYLGGSAQEEGEGIAIDGSGAAYLTGYTSSNQTTFPVVTGPNLSYSGNGDAFVTKVSALPGTDGPVVAFRNGFSAIETITFPSTLARNSDGVFHSNPAAALSASRRVFITARDSGVGIWVNFLKPDNTYNGWVFAGGNTSGNPDVAVVGETAWIAFRDPWNGYWVRSYTPGSGFGSATWIQGILATDPKIAACPNGDLYVAGRDQWGGMWTRRYSGSWQSWVFIGGITIGTPAIGCGSDNAAYIATRDTFNSMWMARVFQEAGASWFFGEGYVDTDLQVAANGNQIHVVGMTAGAPWYRTWIVGSGWQAWVSTNGVLAHCTPAVYNGRLYLVGQDVSNHLYWWSSLNSGWTEYGLRNVSPGSRFSAAAR